MHIGSFDGKGSKTLAVACGLLLTSVACIDHADSKLEEPHRLDMALDPEAPEPQDGPFPEIQVSESDIVDFEFDWGRDGVHCDDCNFGDGNSRFTFTDEEQNMWLGHVDPKTGEFDPPDGRGVLLDTESAFATDFGNGPEWMFSAAGSAIVYTRYLPDRPQSTLTACAALATANREGWTAKIMPGAFKRQSPIATLDLDDPAPRINYQDYRKENIYWVDVQESGSIGPEQLLPIAEQTGGGSRRWVPETRKVIYSGRPPAPEGQQVHPQVLLYDTDTNELEQLTFERTTKYGAFMWRAPEYDGEYVFFTLSDRTQIRVYRQDKATKKWKVSATFDAPETMPYIWSPEPFVYNGKSYVYMQLSSSKKANDMTVPTQLGMVGILPDSQFRMLTNDTTTRRIRMDPEHFITEKGAFIYYNRYVPGVEGSHDVQNDGVWRVDTRLGPPKDPGETDDAGVGDEDEDEDEGDGVEDAGVEPTEDAGMAPVDDMDTDDDDDEGGSSKGCATLGAPSGEAHWWLLALGLCATRLRRRRSALGSR